MKRVLSIGLVAWLCVGCGSSSDNDGEGGTGSTGCSGSEVQKFECEVLELVNKQRAQGADCGGEAMAPAGAVTMHASLRKAARSHAEDMAARNYFDHTSPENEGPVERVIAEGYTYSNLAENIAKGSPTPEEVMSLWMNSPGHCKNIMGPVYEDLGVGYANPSGAPGGDHWVQVFGKSR